MKGNNHDEKIKMIRERTKELTQSKEKARAYLKESGIADFLEKAKQKEPKDVTLNNGMK